MLLQTFSDNGYSNVSAGICLFHPVLPDSTPYADRTDSSYLPLHPWNLTISVHFPHSRLKPAVPAMKTASYPVKYLLLQGYSFLCCIRIPQIHFRNFHVLLCEQLPFFLHSPSTLLHTVLLFAAVPVHPSLHKDPTSELPLRH